MYVYLRWYFLIWQDCCGNEKWRSK